jgi:hypothetical protein
MYGSPCGVIPLAWAGLKDDKIEGLAQRSREIVESALRSAEPVTVGRIG